MTTLDTADNRLKLLDLISLHYLGCDKGDLELATSMMQEDVLFTLPPLGQRFTNRTETQRGLAQVITKLPRMVRHRPAGFRFLCPDPSTLQVQFTTHIMSCVNGAVFAIGDITVDAGIHQGTLLVRAWEVRPIFFRGLITAGKLATVPRILLSLFPFVLPSEVRALLQAASGKT